MQGADWARDVAERLLAEPLPRRWTHTQAVAARARALAPLLGAEVEIVESAGWLHDIGYAPSIADTGFHPLDGARHLRDRHDAPSLLSGLVAHHTCATIEAGERGLLEELLGEFPLTLDVERLLPALTYADMTTGPSGEPLTVEQRIGEIQVRYPPHHVVRRSIDAAAPSLRAQVAAITARLEAEGLPAART